MAGTAAAAAAAADAHDDVVVDGVYNAYDPAQLRARRAEEEAQVPKKKEYITQQQKSAPSHYFA